MFRLLCATSKRVHSFTYSKSLRTVSGIVLIGHGCLHGKMDLRLHVGRRRHCCSIPVLRTPYAPRGFFTLRRYLIDTHQHACGHCSRKVQARWQWHYNHDVNLGSDLACLLNAAVKHLARSSMYLFTRIILFVFDDYDAICDSNALR